MVREARQGWKIRLLTNPPFTTKGARVDPANLDLATDCRGPCPGDIGLGGLRPGHRASQPEHPGRFETNPVACRRNFHLGRRAPACPAAHMHGFGGTWLYSGPHA